MYRKKLRIIAICALVVCLAIAFVLWRSFDKYIFDEAGFYPVDGMKYPVSPGDSGKLGDDERYAVLQLGELDEISGEETCVYVDDRDAIITTSTMCILPRPVDGQVLIYKLGAFSDIQRNISNLLITASNRSYLGDALLLYNGNDTYIVLEKSTLSYGNTRVTLSPLSYIVVCRDQWVKYYDYSSDQYTFDTLEQGTGVEIEINNWDLKIEAEMDKGTCEGNEFMFFTSVNYLDDFFNHYY